MRMGFRVALPTLLFGWLFKQKKVNSSLTDKTSNFYRPLSPQGKKKGKKTGGDYFFSVQQFEGINMWWHFEGE